MASFAPSGVTSVEVDRAGVAEQRTDRHDLDFTPRSIQTAWRDESVPLRFPLLALEPRGADRVQRDVPRRPYAERSSAVRSSCWVRG